MENFFRQTPYNEVGKQLLDICKSGNTREFMKFIINFDMNEWDDIQQNESNDWRKVPYLIYEHLPLAANDLQVCDIGCGYGSTARLLIKHFDTTGVDISSIKLLEASKIMNTRVAFVENLPFENEEFDIVIAQEVLEHVMDVSKAANEISRILKSEGVAYITTPLNQHWDGPTHVRHFSQESLEKLLKDAGFKIESSKIVYFTGTSKVPDCIFIKAVKL